jgi:hypothetical protein
METQVLHIENKSFQVRTSKNLVLSLAVVVVMALFNATDACAQAFGGGSGTQEDPYKIWMADHLEELATLVNAGNSYTGVYFELTDDIDLQFFSEWTPIGVGTRFEGNFNGKGHAIKNLTVNSPAGSEQGLFGKLGGQVEKLALLDFDITTGGSGAGALAGRATGTISQVYATGKVSALKSVGGLVGYFEGITMTDVYASVDVTSANANCGGLAGEQNNGLITKSYSIGAVIFDGADYQGNFGGIVGSQWGGSPEASVIEYCMVANSKVETPQTWGRARVVGAGTGAAANRASRNNLYWEGTVYNGVPGGTLTSTLEELQMDTTYLARGWDISTSADPSKVWYIKNKETFPIFQWQAGEGASIDKIHAVNPLKAVATAGGLRISGLTAGEDLRLYNTLGQLLYNSKAKAAEQLIPVNSRGIYIVAAKGRNLKALY